MPTIHFKSAMALVGLSRASLWRRIKGHPGSSETIGESKGHTQTRLNLSHALNWAELRFDDEEMGHILPADAGDAKAQCELGLILIEHQRPERAIYWLELAAAQGYADAMQWLGQLTASGQDVEKDKARGIERIKQAAEHGHFIARRQVEALGL
jgi:TPR repeat protein